MRGDVSAQDRFARQRLQPQLSSQGKSMPNSYFAECSIEELRQVAANDGRSFVFHGRTVVISTQPGVSVFDQQNHSSVELHVAEGESKLPADSEVVAILNSWDMAGRFRAT